MLLTQSNASCTDALTPLNKCLQSDNLSKLPGGRPLPRADYGHTTKAVRRLLKQLGSGSVTAGVRAARYVEGSAAKELAALLEVRCMWDNVRDVSGGVRCQEAAPSLDVSHNLLEPQPAWNRWSGIGRGLVLICTPSSSLMPQVTPRQVASEAAAVPDSDLDIDTLYRTLLCGGPGFATALAEGEEGGGGEIDYTEMFK